MKILLCLLSLVGVAIAATGRCTTPMEVMVLLDKSGDLDDIELSSMNKFVKALSTDFHVSPHGSHMAYVLAGNSIDVQISFIRHGMTKKLIKKQLGKMETSSNQEWNVANALEFIEKDLVLTKARRFLPVILIIIVRGLNPSGDYRALANAAAKLHQENVKVYVMNMQQNTPMEALRSMVEEENRIFNIESPENLANKAKTVSSEICAAHKDSMKICNVPVDIGFIVDSSGSINNAGYRSMKNFMMGVSLSMGFQKNLTHIGVVLYSNEAEVSFKFQDFELVRKLFRAIRDLPHRRMLTRIDLGLRVAERELFTKDGGSRDHVTKIAILLTDGEQTTENITDLIPLSEAGEAFHKRGITIFALGIGKNVKKEQLYEIVGNEDRIILANSFADLEDGAHKIAEQTCRQVVDAVINFTKPVYSFVENQKAVVELIVVDGKINQPTTVFVSTTPRSAGEKDFISTTQSVVFQPGETGPKPVEITLIDDDLLEDVETLKVSLNSTYPVLLGKPAFVNILDNDGLICGTEKDDCDEYATCTDTSPGKYRCMCIKGYWGDGFECIGVLIGFTSRNYTFGEDEKAAVEVMVKSGVITSDVTVLVTSKPSTASKNDFAPVSENVTFRSGETGPKPVKIDLNDDLIVETTEEFSIDLSTSSPGAEVEGPTFVTILDNDEVVISFTQDVYDVKEDETPVVQLGVTSGELDIHVTIQVATRPSTAKNDDFISKTVDVTFQPGEKGPKSIPIEIVDDPEVEATEQFKVNFMSASSPSVQFGEPALVNILDNDEAVVEFTKPVYNYKEDEVTGVAIEITSGKLDTPVNIRVKTAPSSATEKDFTAPTIQVVTFNPGETGPKTIDIKLFDDDDVESIEYFNVSFVSSSVPGVKLGKPASVNILDNDDAVVSFTKPIYDSEEGGPSGVAIQLNKKIDFPVTVAVSTAPGTAEEHDFVATTQDVTFNPGETGPKPIDIKSVVDNIVEPTEQFNVSFISSSSPSVKLGKPASVNILDYGGAVVSFTKRVYDGKEGKTAGVAVRLDRRVDFSVKIQIATEPGTADKTDFTSTTKFVIFNPGETGPKPIDIMLVDDDIVEPSEQFNVSFASSSSPRVKLGKPALVNIEDNGGAVVSFTKRVYDGKEGKTAGVAVRLDRRVDFSVKIQIATEPGTADKTDFTSTTKFVIFNPGETGPKPIDIKLVDDDIVELSEQFNVSFVSSSSPRVKLGKPALVNIEDNDEAVVTFTRGAYLHREDGVPDVAIKLNKNVDYPVTVQVATNPATAEKEDFATQTQEVTFNPGQTGPKPIVIKLVDDDLLESNERFNVLLVSSSSPRVKLGDPASVVILDNDEVAVSFTKPVYEAREDETPDVEIQLSGKLDSPVTIQVATAPATAKNEDFVKKTLSVTFNPGETGPKLVDITFVDDNATEVTEKFHVSFLSTSVSGVKLGEPAQVNILDNDEVVVDFTKPVYETKEDKKAVVGVHVTSGKIGAPVTISVIAGASTASDKDFVPMSKDISFGPGDTGPVFIDIEPVDDAMVEKTEELTVSFVSSSLPSVKLGKPTAVKILDNDEAVVSFTKPVYYFKENGSVAVVQIILAGKVDTPVTVRVSGGPISQTPREVTFQPGETGPRPVIYKWVDDNIVEPTESFQVSLSTETPGVKVGKPSSIKILDDDVVHIDFTNRVYDVYENETAVVEIQIKSGRVGTPLSIGVSTSPSSAGVDDFKPMVRNLVFGPGETGPKLLRIDIIDDKIVESTENFTLTLTSNVPAVTVGKPATVNIFDNDKTDECSFDIGFVVDSSGSMRGCNYENEKKFIKKIASYAPESSRTSIIVYAENAILSRKFNYPGGMENFYAQVNDLPYHRGSADLEKAMDLAASSMFSEENGMRDFDIPKVLIVLNDGSQTSIPEPKLKKILSALRENDVRVIVVGVGEADKKFLNQFVELPNHLILVETFEGAEKAVAALLKDFCLAECTTVSKPVNVEIEGCVSQKPVNMRFCSGSCSPRMPLKGLVEEGSEAYEYACNCCKPRRKATKTVSLQCGDGSKSFRILEATSCACRSC